MNKNMIPYTESENYQSRVNHPSYYNLKDGPFVIAPLGVQAGDIIPIECVDVIRNMPGWKAQAIKYEWRAGEKEEEGMDILDKEIEDLEKAQWWLGDRLIQLKQKAARRANKKNK